jgi:hypothetical protein
VLKPFVVKATDTDIFEITDNVIMGLKLDDDDEEILSSRMTEGGYNALTFNSTITGIGDYAFEECEILCDSTTSTPITFESNALSIGISAFQACDGITQINLALSNTIISSIGD